MPELRFHSSKKTDQSTVKQEETEKKTIFTKTGFCNDSTKELYQRILDSKLSKVSVNQDTGALYRDMIDSIKKKQSLKP